MILPRYYTPRDYQKESNKARFGSGQWEKIEESTNEFETVFYEGSLYKINGARQILQVNHRRSGKDRNAFNMLITSTQLRIGTYYYLFPEQGQAREVIWEGLTDEGRPFLADIPSNILSGRPDKKEMRCKFKNGSVLRIGGTKDIDRWMGTNAVGVVISEAQNHSPKAWDYIRPIINYNKGWVIFVGTPRGMNNVLYNLYKSAIANPDLWYMEKLTVKDTKRHNGKPVFSEEDIDYERRSGMPEEMIQQEYYCDFTVSNVGAFYGTYCDKLLTEKRFIDFDVDPTLPTFMGWDLGHHDPTALVIVQLAGREIHFVYVHESPKQDLDYFIDLLRKFQQKHHINFIQPFYPHDIKVHELIAGSRYEYLEDKGYTSGDPDFDIIDGPIYSKSLMEGINAVRSLFDRFIIHKTECDHVLNCLQTYSKGYNSTTKSYNSTPTHDWSSHVCDAIRYLCVGIKQYELQGCNPIRMFKNDF